MCFRKFLIHHCSRLWLEINYWGLILSLVKTLGLWCDGQDTEEQGETRLYALGREGASPSESAKGCRSILGAPPPAGGGLYHESCPSRELSRAEERRPVNPVPFRAVPDGASFPSPCSLPFPFLSKTSRVWLLWPEIRSVSPVPSTRGC